MNKLPPVVFAALWLVSSPAQAQPLLDIALKGGANSTTLTRDYRTNRYGVTGGLAGYLRWPLGSTLSIAAQLELLYTARGAEAIFEGEYLGRIRQHYFDIVVVARPEARLGLVSVYLLLGGGLDALLSANQEDVSGMKADVTDVLNRLDVALLLGGGVAFHLPQRGLGSFRLSSAFIEARYGHGLIDTDIADGESENRDVSLMLGVSFALRSEDDK